MLPNFFTSSSVHKEASSSLVAWVVRPVSFAERPSRPRRAIQRYDTAAE